MEQISRCIWIKSIFKRIAKLALSFNEEARVKLAYASYISLEIGGTGKGAFRKMFSRFLKKAAYLLHDDRLNLLSKEYLVLASLWSELANLLHEGSHDPIKGLFSGNEANERLTNEIYREGNSGTINKIKRDNG